MLKVSKGDLVYIPGAEAAFIPAHVVHVDRNGDGVEVQLEKPDGSRGESQHIACSELRPRFLREDGTTSQDNTSLVHMNDATILDNLRARHEQNEIYTYTASVLLALNPYKDIKGLYGEEQCARYKGKHIGALPPHPYAIADSAYRALVREQRNQGLLISGESGAGKTETAKIVMQFLAFASGAASGHADSIQARVLRAQPILESFGNAVTMRNSNSSRFGKYNRVFFDTTGALVDAGITTYLLESSRVVVHSEKERTYHCFYEMLKGLSDEKLEALGLDRTRRYRLLCDPSGETMPGFETRDAVNFVRLCDALKTVGLDDAAVDNMLRLLAGLIHLGDVEKDEASPRLDLDDENEIVEVDEASVDKAAQMLGMDPDEMRAKLTRKKVAVPGRSSYHEVPRSNSQFRHALQSFIKALYKRLFERTVQRINESFRELRPSTQRGDEDAWRHIGILDIYGFERLQRNSFEQLCINLANERLQQYFVENVLRAEQDLYKREGLPWTGLALPDATPVFNAIGQVFRTLDEYSQNLSKGVGNATDKNFCQKVVDEAVKDAERKNVLRQLKMTGGTRRSMSGAGPSINEGFIIKHYAGQVEYNTKGWLDKNNDRLLVECEELISESTDPLVRSLSEEDQGPKALFRSISKKYQKDLECLLETLGTCHLHYIRCFKPNGEQKPDIFCGQLVLDQIVQCGTIELVKIMHDGYPNRCMFEEITTRFRDLLPENFQRYGMRTFIEALMLAYDVPREEWALGMSRLFLKAGQLRALEGMRSEGATPSAEKLAQIVRGIIQKRWKRGVQAVQLCNYIPKFIERIRLRRLAVRRRLVGAFFTVRLLRAQWELVRQRRRSRLVAVLRLAVFLQTRSRPWVAAAKERVAERRRQEERQREEEAQRLERERQVEARQFEEEKRRQEAALREEREQQQRREREQEQQRREEEERQRLEAVRQREVEAQRELERQREELRQKDEADRRALEEERRRFEEQRSAFEEEKRRNAIRYQASPMNGKKATMMQGFAEDIENQSGAGDSSLTAQASTGIGEEDDLTIGDSVSNVGTGVQSNTHHSVAMSVKEEMEETVRRLEREMAQKHEEIKAQMALLQEKNASLAAQLEEERQQKLETKSHASGYGRSDCPADSPVPRSPSLIDLDDTHDLQHTPSTPDCSSGRKKLPRPSYSRSGQKYSLLSIDGGSTSRATASKKRHSIAHEALLRQDNPDRCYAIGEAASTTGDLGSQRKWWAEQRQFLLDDLYGTSPAQRAPMNSSRTSIRHKEPAVEPSGHQHRDRRTTVPASVAEEDEEGNELALHGDSARTEVRNLNTMFETADDAPFQSRSASTGSAMAARQARTTTECHGTKMRLPTQFEWSKRQSLGGGER